MLERETSRNADSLILCVVLYVLVAGLCTQQDYDKQVTVINRHIISHTSD
jgi:hypothetical protein